MRKINIGIVGCGTVGLNVIKILLKHSSIVNRKVGCEINIKWVCDKDTSRFKQSNLPRETFTSDASKIILDPSVDIIVELIGGMDVSKKIIIEAMNRGKHIVTANKAVLSSNWDEIFSLALRKKVLVYFEAAVGAGIPIIQSLNEGLAANKIQSIIGILNGTTNFILSKMTDDNMSFDEAVKLAQKSGFAESNPSLDIDGSDAAHKLSILASIAYGNHLPFEKIYREGISDINSIDIKYAKEEFNYVLKLLATVKNENNEISATVYPTFISDEHPLASVENEYNAIYVDGDFVGDVMFYGKGAGGSAAASAVVSDIIYLARNIFYGIAGKSPYISYDKKVKLNIKPVENIETKYYIRVMTADKPGALSKIFGILGDNNVSISACLQEECHKKYGVPIVMLTHQAKEGNIRKAIKIINNLSFVKTKAVVLRIME
ncbi:MAG: homoserine dehydrogenase [Elusimicrobia bacterium]|nr:homoserine dehydrogenase [Elusimicrobiota bacterium]